MQSNVDRATLHGKAPAGNQQAVGSMLGNTQGSGSQRGNTSGLHAGSGNAKTGHPIHETDMTAEEDHWYKYACRIEEEPAPNNL